MQGSIMRGITYSVHHKSSLTSLSASLEWQFQRVARPAATTARGNNSKRYGEKPMSRRSYTCSYYKHAFGDGNEASNGRLP